jgi:adenylate cyclase
MHSSLETSHQLLQLAESLNDDTLIMEAHRAIGAALVLSGGCSEALEHIEKGAALCALRQNQCDSLFVVLNSKVMFECFAALALFSLGYPDQSAERLAAGLAMARQLGHPQTLVVAEHIAAQIHQMRREPTRVCEFAKEAVDLSDEYGLELWRAYGIIELGWAEAELGNAQAGIEQMQRGLELHESMGSKLRSPFFLGLLADQLAKAGRVEDGLATAAKGITLAEQTGERYSLAELYRIKGELLMQAFAESRNRDRRKANSTSAESSPLLEQAKSCFADALAIAKQQQAIAWESRILASVERLREQSE